MQTTIDRRNKKEEERRRRENKGIYVEAMPAHSTNVIPPVYVDRKSMGNATPNQIHTQNIIYIDKTYRGVLYVCCLGAGKHNNILNSKS